MPWEILDRMELAVERVTERLLRSTAALNRAGINYAVVRGHAVASWVATVDEGAVRNSPDIDLLVHREHLSEMATVLEQAGFIRANFDEGASFIDGPGGKPREAVHLLFAGEKARDDDAGPLPQIVAVDDPAGFRVLDLALLVELLLLLNRNQDRMHLHDLIHVGLIDHAWPAKLPPILAERLQAILDTPDG